MVVTGDITQVDLPGGTRSGLRVVRGVLDNVDDITFCNLTNHDVVRHKLVGRIVAAYDKFEASHIDASRAESAAPAPPQRPGR
jgi:phosphate starvation-inducible PhoH-like protein